VPKLPAAGVILAVAILTAALVFGVLQWRASTATISAGFWFDDFAFDLPADATARLGGPLTGDDVATITRVARAEVERAFAGLRIVVTGERDAFWRVRVLRDIRRAGGVGRPNRLPISGESFGLGPLGGAGSVNFMVAALGAVTYAPHDASRQAIIDGIGRGIGRAAVHEFGHAIVGANHSQDEHSYEYRSSDRASQYYGELHWASAGPLLQRRFGK
jgi:hypothetical protein